MRFLCEVTSQSRCADLACEIDVKLAGHADSVVYEASDLTRALRRLESADKSTWCGLLAELDRCEGPMRALSMMGLLD